jgi:predicted ArsR family transcriptional regulator
MHHYLTATKENGRSGIDMDSLYVLLQPTRQKIVQVLRESKEPMYIKQIADKIGESERNVSFHLLSLAEKGLVDGQYREIEQAHHSEIVKGRAAKFYHLTPKVDEILKQLEKGI